MRRAAAPLLCGSLLLGGCAAVDRGEAARQTIDALAAQAGFIRRDLPAGFTDLAVWTRPAAPASDRLTLFLEGDGQPWATRWQPARDPSPSDPIAFRLAAATPGAVAYLARPCQFASPAAAARCRVEHWTSHRYGEEVVAAVNQAVNHLAGGRRLTLVGYSGGGTVAALVAARRHDVVRLITVAAPLDVVAWARAHGQPPLAGSLSPLDQADRLVALPQLHFVARDDTAVPPAVNDAMFARLPAAVVRRVAGDHDCCWVERWHDWLAEPAPAFAPASASFHPPVEE